MPDTRGKPLPAEVLDALKSPTVQSWLKNFVINQGSASSIGRIPGFESAQNDQYVYPDDADATFAYNFDYVIPSNFQRLVSAKLSFKIRAFRSYNNFSATSTGNDTPTHWHVHNHGAHSHSHQHTMFTDTASALALGATGELYNTVGGSTNPQVQFANANTGTLLTDVNAVATTPATDTTAVNQNHTHPVSITSTLGIFEDVAPANPGITVKVDGTDVTAQLKPAGPYQVDQVEIELAQVLKTAPKVWHTLSLQPNQRVRITGILRIVYFVDGRLAQ